MLKKLLPISIVLVLSIPASAVTVSLEGEGTTIITPPGSTLVVNILSDAPITPDLGLLDADVSITGDAVFSSAMSTADCHLYGWDPLFSVDPMWRGYTIIELAFSSFNTVPAGIVGYVEVTYGSGPVTVSIAYGHNFFGIPERPIPNFSTGVVTFIPEPATLLLLALGGLVLRKNGTNLLIGQPR